MEDAPRAAPEALTRHVASRLVSHVVIVMPQAAREIADACAWWQQNRPAAPTLLMTELDRAFDRLADNPNMGPAWPRRPGLRRLVITRVEVLLFYRVRPRARRVEVVALWHGLRGTSPLR